MIKPRGAARILVVAPLLASLLGGCVSTGARRPADRFLEGRAIAVRSCAGCHAVEATGESRDPVAPPFRALTLRFPPGDLQAHLNRVSAHGHANMPPIYVTPDERRALAAYIRGLAARRPAPETAGR